MIKVVLSGYSGFPYSKSATRQKQMLIAKAIQINPGYNTIIINYISYSNKTISKKGFFDGVSYKVNSLFSKKPTNRFLSLINLTYGYVNELIFLLRFNPNFLIVADRNIIYLIMVLIISKLSSIKLILTAVEDFESLNKSKLLHKLINKIYYNFIVKNIDGVFPISSSIENKIKKYNSKVSQLRLPVFTDFDNFLSNYKINESNYFLYCGTANYDKTIKFIIKSYLFKPLKSNLIIVTSGSVEKIEELKLFAEKSKFANKIKFFTNIEYDYLVSLYKNANALLIPMFQNIIDNNRFPHKIAEYCASKRPIISTSYGEISDFFTDNMNAFLMKKSTVKNLSEKMQTIEKDKPKANLIGLNSYNLGKSIFNYKSYSDPLKNFLNSLDE